jgi:hypothetical protein
MSPTLERRALQLVITLAGLVPVGAGGWGVIGGLGRAGVAASQGRYLSGLLLGVGLVFWWTIPAIERRGAVVRALAAVVVVGGLSRLAGAVVSGHWSSGVVLPLVMELGVTPAIAVWRERVERLGAGAV